MIRNIREYRDAGMHNQSPPVFQTFAAVPELVKADAPRFVSSSIDNQCVRGTVKKGQITKEVSKQDLSPR